MAKISELISKYVISLYNGQIEGVVENALFSLDTNRLRYLIVYSEQTESTYALPVTAIYSVGDGAISIRNNSYLSLYESKELELSELCNPINSNAFKINGDNLGVVTDIYLDDKYYISKVYLSDDVVVEKKDIASFNKNTLLVKDKESNVNVKNFARRVNIKPKETDTRIVNILQIKSEQEHQTKLNDAESTPYTTLVPNRAIANYTFLINRKVQKNIMSQNGNLIIRQNTKINENVINIARQNGKLKELTRYSY